MLRPYRAAALALVALPALAPAAAAPLHTRTVALSGDAAAGGVGYAAFGDVALDASGRVGFSASLTGAGVDATNDRGLWSESAPGTLNVVARAGDAAPGIGPSVKFSAFRNPVLNAAGQTAFIGNVVGATVDGTNNSGIWSEANGTPSSPRLVSREGDAAPGTERGVRYRGANPPALGQSGAIAFLSVLTGAGVNNGNDTGIWSAGGSGVSGSPRLIAREGEAAPGTDPGVTFTSVFHPVIDATGRSAFIALISDLDADGFSRGGVWSDSASNAPPDGPGVVVIGGDPAAGTGPGVNFNTFSNLTINASGQTAFIASLNGTGVDSTNDLGIWSEASGGPGVPGLVARAGDAAPGTGAGVYYSGFDSTSPLLNAAGQTAFSATLTGAGVNSSNDRGIWSDAAGAIGSPGLVAREGDAAPGTSVGVKYELIVGPTLNGTGQTAFLARVTGATVDASNDIGLWATDLDGLVTLIAREGDRFDADDDPITEDFRTIDSIDFTFGNGSGRSTAFNDAGEIAFGLDFTDGTSGVFIALIPEPATAVVLALLPLASRRRAS